MTRIQLEGQDVATFLRGHNTIRDGFLRSLSIRPTGVEWDPVLDLVFHVPEGPEGQHYHLELKGGLDFEHVFSTPNLLSPLAMVKCLWTEEGKFYLSLDPYDEREDFISLADGDYFKSDWVRLTVGDDRR